MNESLRKRLCEMKALDEQVRAALLETGELYDGYCPKMEKVHLENAAELEKMLTDNNGWLGKSVVGTDGADAAWLIAMHAISLPDFARRCLKLITEAVEKGEAEARHAAILEDRINYFERKPQKYGSQSGWNADGKMEVWTLEDEERVNEFRAEVGLEPLTDLIWETEETRRNAPQDSVKRQAEFEIWLKKTGWK